MPISSDELISLARTVSGLARKFGLVQAEPQPGEAQPSPINILDLYENLVTDRELRKHTEQRFLNGHYQDAVFEAFKYVNNYVKNRVKTPNSDGAPLMRSAFSANSPILKLNDLANASKKDEQQGYMDIFAGSMIGIRNPRAHENDFDNDPNIALQLLCLAQHLLTKAKRAKHIIAK